MLSLLSQVAEEQPLVCLVDDEQWIDRCSAQVLAFVARRLMAESVGLVFAARIPSDDLTGLPELEVRGLSDAHARVLLDSVLSGPIDERVREQIVAETRGNPLALLELPRGLTVAQLAGGFGLPAALPLASSIEEAFERRVEALPDAARTILLLAAADPTGDPALVWRAAGRLGVTPAAAGPAADAGIAEFDIRVRFRHPLARSAAYRAASALARRAAHRALAEVTDAALDPARRAWHRAQAAAGPDAEIADELERSAGRALARGGLAATAAFLKQAATLTLDPAQRAGRALGAAEAKLRAGVYAVAKDLLAMAESGGGLGDRDQARADVLRAQLAFFTSRGGEAPGMLLRAARRLEPIDADLCRTTYLDAQLAAIFAGRLAPPGEDVLAVARAASAAPPPCGVPIAPDLLLDGTAAALHVNYAAGFPLLRKALTDFGVDMSVEEELRRMYFACITALRLWDDERWELLSSRYLRLARDTGALSELPLALTARAYMHLFAGDLAAAAALTAEMDAVKEATGSSLAPYCALGLAALRGDAAETTALVEATIEEVTLRGEGIGITFAEWASATLDNGLGNYARAMAAAQRACSYDADPGSLVWPTVELVEAAARTGAGEVAAAACARLDVLTGPGDTEWGLGVLARSRALVSAGEPAEHLYREAIARLGKTRLRVDLARAHLLYGEWLRRERRRTEAREQLRMAHDMLDGMGVAAFAERAGRELRATGTATATRSRPTLHEELTAQEAQVAGLARDGLSNPEIGTRLFLSAHTVQYHLRKVFTKLGITSRSQLDRVLPPVER